MKEETTITFLASECGEFHGMGECIECTSLKEAFWHYQRFCKRSPKMGPSLEFSLHHADDPLYNERELKKQVIHTLRNRKMIWLLPLKLRSVVTENEKKNLHI